VIFVLFKFARSGLTDILNHLLPRISACSLAKQFTGYEPVEDAPIAGTLTQLTPMQAYDPMFYFLHAAMDKYMAMWQHLNPDMWVEPTSDIFGTYTRDINQMVDEDTILTPFFRDNKEDREFLSSADMRDISNFGYDYPILAGSPSRQDLLDTVKDMYGNFALNSNQCALAGQFENCLEEACNDPTLSTAENCTD
jgi:hypothetical protein